MISSIDGHTVGKIINSQWPWIQQHCNTYQLRILNALRRCRTSGLGGHVYQCDKCSSTHYRYHSCRNRHCPQCQNTEKERWIMARSEQLINVPYYHIVFTIPDYLNQMCLAYPRLIYGLLFKSAWQTLSDFAWNHKYLGAQIGATMMLHTWGSNMSFHPHLHCIVPAGGVSWNGKWKPAKGNGKFLFPVKGLSQVFRAKFINELKKLSDTIDLQRFDVPDQKHYRHPWVVYCKAPFGGPQAVIKYLGRYTHKVAITHHRILSYNDQEVIFRYTDYKHRNQKKTMRLSTHEFVRRFTLHFLPKGFPRIRHYGILSSAWKKRMFPNASTEKVSWQQVWKAKGVDFDTCPFCKSGTLQYVSNLKPVRGPPVYPNNQNTDQFGIKTNKSV